MSWTMGQPAGLVRYDYVRAFFDAFPAPRDPKSADFFSFHLEFWARLAAHTSVNTYYTAEFFLEF